MSMYFDIRDNNVGVIGTDEPDEDFILMEEGQSTLALRYSVVDGAVVDMHPGKTDEEVLAELFEAQQQEAAVVAPVSKVISRLAFTERFTMDELVAIYTLAKTNVLFEVFLDKLKIAESVDLEYPAITQSIQGMVMAGVLSAERAAEILA